MKVLDTIRWARQSDTKQIIATIAQKKCDYITCQQIREDINKGKVLLGKIESKIVCFLVVERNAEFKYVSIRRAMVPNKKYRKKGVMNELLSSICDYADRDYAEPLGATPWTDNIAMKKLLEKNGFIYQYTFQSHWEYWQRKNNR